MKHAPFFVSPENCPGKLPMANRTEWGIAPSGVRACRKRIQGQIVLIVCRDYTEFSPPMPIAVQLHRRRGL
jgi:hypothetical protein